MKLLFKLGLTTLLASAVSIAQAQPPEISDARIIQPPPGAKVAAAYFTVQNNSQEPLVIISASTESAANVSIHLSVVENDVAKMIPQDSITIDAGSSLEFKHGSYHLMLMGLKAPLTPGTMLAFEIETSAGVLPTMIPIITPDQASSAASHSMKHDSKHSDGDMKHGDMDNTKSTDKN